MKNALKNYRVYIGALVLVIIGLGVPFLVLGISLVPSFNFNQFEGYPWLIAIFMGVYFLIGYLWGDIKSASYRKKNKNYDGELPEDIKTTCWSRRWPFFLAAIVLLVVFIVIDIYYGVTHHFPFIVTNITSML